MIGFVTGVLREAACLGGLPEPRMAACSGADFDRAEMEAGRLLERGATALVSFGLAGGLVDGLAAGALLVPDAVVTEAGERFVADPIWRRLSLGVFGSGLSQSGSDILVTTTIPVTTTAAKRALAERTGAAAVDMESAAVARVAAKAGVPFLVVRAVADPVARGLPAAALAAVGPGGRVRPLAALAALAKAPHQIGTLLLLSLDSAAGLATLRRTARRFRPPPER